MSSRSRHIHERRHVTRPVIVEVFARFAREHRSLDSTIDLDLALWHAVCRQAGHRVPLAEVRSARHAVQGARGLQLLAGDVRVRHTTVLRACVPDAMAAGGWSPATEIVASGQPDPEVVGEREQLVAAGQR